MASSHRPRHPPSGAAPSGHAPPCRTASSSPPPGGVASFAFPELAEKHRLGEGRGADLARASPGEAVVMAVSFVLAVFDDAFSGSKSRWGKAGNPSSMRRRPVSVESRARPSPKRRFSASTGKTNEPAPSHARWGTLARSRSLATSPVQVPARGRDMKRPRRRGLQHSMVRAKGLASASGVRGFGRHPPPSHARWGTLARSRSLATSPVQVPARGRDMKRPRRRGLQHSMVRAKGLEPSRGCPHMDLNHTRLPIPPRPRAVQS